MFAQLLNRLTTHFLERIHVVKRRVSVFSKSFHGNIWEKMPAISWQKPLVFMLAASQTPWQGEALWYILRVRFPGMGSICGYTKYAAVYSRECAVSQLNSLNAQLNHICHLLALLGAHRILHFSRISVKGRQSWYQPLYLTNQQKKILQRASHFDGTIRRPIHSQLNWAILLCDVIPEEKT